MTARQQAAVGEMLFGAAGLLLAALVYVGSLNVGGLLRSLMPQPLVELVLFVIFLAFSLAEIPVMVLGLRTLKRGRADPRLVHLATIIYVAFAAAYAGLLILFFGPSPFANLLAGLAFLRWVSSRWIS